MTRPLDSHVVAQELQWPKVDPGTTSRPETHGYSKEQKDQSEKQASLDIIPVTNSLCCHIESRFFVTSGRQ